MDAKKTEPKLIKLLLCSKFNLFMIVLFVTLFLVGLTAGGNGGVTLCLTSLLAWPAIGYNSLNISIERELRGEKGEQKC